MSKTILVGCKLPNGLTVDLISGKKLTINGVNTSLIAGGFGITHVPEDDAAFIFATYAEHSAFLSKAVFTADTAKVDDVLAVAEELVDEKTGFEGIDPAKPGATSGDGNKLTPSDKQVVPDENSKVVTVRKARSKADAAAAAELAAKLAV